MSTRALYTFADEGGEYHVYKHHDGYPEGALGFIDTAKRNAWQLPRFEADEFAAAFIAQNKDGPGGVRLTIGKTWEEAVTGDSQYHYVVTARGKELNVDVYEVGSNRAGDPMQKLVKSGLLPDLIKWAKPEEEKNHADGPVIAPVNEAGDHATGRLPASLTVAKINKVLGFKPNISDDPDKTKHSWGFTVDGKRCGIWDYKGSRWSIFDPHNVLPGLFGTA